MTVRAIYEDGVFKPTEPVDLPDRSQVEFEPKLLTDQVAAEELTVDESKAMQELYGIMSKRFRSGRHDIAERHNEHQP